MRDRFHLPSGAVVELGAFEPLPLLGLFASDAARCRVSLVRARRAKAVDQLPLADFHTLRVLLRSVGIIPEDEVELVCTNCGRSWWVRPCAGLELGPYRDGELKDPELDGPFRFDLEHPLVSPGETEWSSPINARLRPITIREAEPLLVALSRREGRLLWDKRLVLALGLRALGGEGDAGRLAHLLRRDRGGSLEELGQLFENAHYPPRLTVGHPCPSCHMLEWVNVPAVREFTVHPSSAEVRAARSEMLARVAATFPTLEEFEGLARAAAARVHAPADAEEVALVVLDGPAECDEGGEPLLGAYYPPEPENLPPEPPEIHLYYRTFLNSHLEDGPYDVDREIEETLRHELEHHLGHLTGSDPLDEHERAEIANEYQRRVGQRESWRRMTMALVLDSAGFVRKTWWVWLLALLATVLVTWADA